MTRMRPEVHFDSVQNFIRGIRVIRGVFPLSSIGETDTYHADGSARVRRQFRFQRFPTQPNGSYRATLIGEFSQKGRLIINETTHDHSEGKVARTIEDQTAKLPSDLFLWAAIGSMATSFTLRVLGKKDDAMFVGQWAPAFLILGTYNKMVKQHGSD
jgi:hypothetical protein